MGMATDYDAPRKTDEDTDSIQALQERVPDKMSGVVDVDDADNPGFELAGQDLSDLDLDVVTRYRRHLPGRLFSILMDARVEGFPFNVLRDPMYVGSMMCFAATALWRVPVVLCFA